MNDKLPKFEGMTEDDETVLRGAIARMNASDVEQFNEYEQRITDLEAKLAEAQRREGLLKAFWHKFHATKVKRTYYGARKIAYDLDEWNELLEVFNAAEAAIDGGALEVE